MGVDVPLVHRVESLRNSRPLTLRGVFVTDFWERHSAPRWKSSELVFLC